MYPVKKTYNLDILTCVVEYLVDAGSTKTIGNICETQRLFRDHFSHYMLQVDFVALGLPPANYMDNEDWDGTFREVDVDDPFPVKWHDPAVLQGFYSLVCRVAKTRPRYKHIQHLVICIPILQGCIPPWVSSRSLDVLKKILALVRPRTLRTITGYDLYTVNPPILPSPKSLVTSRCDDEPPEFELEYVSGNIGELEWLEPEDLGITTHCLHVRLADGGENPSRVCLALKPKVLCFEVDSQGHHCSSAVSLLRGSEGTAEVLEIDYPISYPVVKKHGGAICFDSNMVCFATSTTQVFFRTDILSHFFLCSYRHSRVFVSSFHGCPSNIYPFAFTLYINPSLKTMDLRMKTTTMSTNLPILKNSTIYSPPITASQKGFATSSTDL